MNPLLLWFLLFVLGGVLIAEAVSLIAKAISYKDEI